MNILFLTDNFPPEGNAPATRTYEHACEWVKRGCQVTVITCAPNFPKGVVYEGYRNKWLSREKIDGINVWRVKTYITANEGFLKRIIDYISFMFSSLFFGLFVKKVDVVIGTSPQFFTVVSAWILAKCKRSSFVFELRDIWPASISSLGVMSGKWILIALEKLELFLYHQADLIISVTHSFKRELQDRGVSGNKIKVILNGVNLQRYKPLKEKNENLADMYKLKNKFVVGYIGTHGLAQGLESVVNAAELIKKHNNIRIIFAGAGAERSKLEKIVQDRKLENVVMIPFQPRDKMQELWSLCDISLVHLKDLPIFRDVIPSKIFESMAMGLPILIATPIGEATSIVKNYNAGINISPENPKELSDKIIELANDDELVKILSRQSLGAAQNFNRESLASEMLDYIREVVS